MAAPPVEPIGSTTVATPGADMLTVSLSNAQAGAKRVALTLKLHTELICGQPGPSPLVVKLPAAASVPTVISRRAVLVGTRPARAIAVHGNTIRVAPPPHKGLLCDVVAPGTITVRFAKAARIGNPESPGTYTISLRRGRSTYAGSVRITR